MKKWLSFLLVVVVHIHGMEEVDGCLHSLAHENNSSKVLPSGKPIAKNKKRKRRKKKKGGKVQECWGDGGVAWYQGVMEMMGQKKDSSLSQAEEYFRNCKKLDFVNESKERGIFFDWVNKYLLDIARVANSELEDFLMKNNNQEQSTSKITDEQRLALYVVGRYGLEGSDKYARHHKAAGWKKEVSGRYYYVYPFDFIHCAAYIGHVPSRLYLATSGSTGLTPSTRVSLLSMLWEDDSVSKKDKEIVWRHMDCYAKQGYLKPLMANILQAIAQDKESGKQCAVDDFFEELDKQFPPVAIRSIDEGIHMCGDDVCKLLLDKKNWSAKAITSCLQVIYWAHQDHKKADYSKIKGMTNEILKIERLDCEKHPQLRSMLGSCYSFLGYAYQEKDDMKNAKAAHGEAMKYADDSEDVLIEYIKSLFDKKGYRNKQMHQNIDEKINCLMASVENGTVKNRKIDSYLLFAAYYSVQKRLDLAMDFLEKAEQQMGSECSRDKGHASTLQALKQELKEKKTKGSPRDRKKRDQAEYQNAIVVPSELMVAIKEADRNVLSNPCTAVSKLVWAAEQCLLFYFVSCDETYKQIYQSVINKAKSVQSNLDSTKQAELKKLLEKLSRLQKEAQENGDVRVVTTRMDKI